MTRPQRNLAAWVAICAVAGMVLGVVYAWVHNGPDHEEWTDAALVLGLIGLCLGVFVGLVVGVLRGETDGS